MVKFNSGRRGEGWPRALVVSLEAPVVASLFHPVMDLTDAELVARAAAAWTDESAAESKAESAFFDSLSAADAGAYVVVLSRIIANRTTPPRCLDFALRKLNEGATWPTAAWAAWRAQDTGAHAAVQQALLKALAAIQDDDGGSAVHPAQDTAFPAVFRAAKALLGAVSESWPKLLPRVMMSATDAAAPVWSRTAAYDLVAAWLDVLAEVKGRVRVPLDKRSLMLATLTQGIAPGVPAPVQRGALSALTSFVAFAGPILVKRSAQKDEAARVIGLVTTLAAGGGTSGGPESRGVIKDAILCLDAFFEMFIDELTPLLPTVAPIVLRAGQAGEAAKDEEGDELVIAVRVLQGGVELLRGQGLAGFPVHSLVFDSMRSLLHWQCCRLFLVVLVSHHFKPALLLLRHSGHVLLEHRRYARRRRGRGGRCKWQCTCTLHARSSRAALRPPPRRSCTPSLGV
jgi:hypothetical protein